MKDDRDPQAMGEALFALRKQDNERIALGPLAGAEPIPIPFSKLADTLEMGSVVERNKFNGRTNAESWTKRGK